MLNEQEMQGKEGEGGGEDDGEEGGGSRREAKGGRSRIGGGGQVYQVSHCRGTEQEGESCREIVLSSSLA